MQEATNILGNVRKIQKILDRQKLLTELSKTKPNRNNWTLPHLNLKKQQKK